MLLIKKVSGKQPTSCKSLVTAFKKLWTKEIFYKYCKRLVVKMPKVIEALLRSYRGNTK